MQRIILRYIVLQVDSSMKIFSEIEYYLTKRVVGTQLRTVFRDRRIRRIFPAGWLPHS